MSMMGTPGGPRVFKDYTTDRLLHEVQSCHYALSRGLDYEGIVATELQDIEAILRKRGEEWKYAAERGRVEAAEANARQWEREYAAKRLKKARIGNGILFAIVTGIIILISVFNGGV